ncbi:hypothetical protein ROR02_05390 [Pararhodospirillum oryzae]|uniref:Uncharacterized protein n=1 Tax=Pararhodospirillum oryzae TaxID=478448 RepID=A0A512H4R3_9PROT|nr:hypothetical protein ROR02_05390 [Pararhodospirillum oryzae]
MELLQLGKLFTDPFLDGVGVVDSVKDDLGGTLHGALPHEESDRTDPLSQADFWGRGQALRATIRITKRFLAWNGYLPGGQGGTRARLSCVARARASYVGRAPVPGGPNQGAGGSRFIL